MSDTGLSTYARHAILGHVFSVTAAYTPPSIYLALCYAQPAPSQTGSQIPECSYTSYARINVTSWARSGYTVSNIGSVAMNTPGSSGSDATHFALVDSLTGGNLLAYGTFDTAIPILNGVPISFANAAISITVSNTGRLDLIILDHLFNLVVYTQKQLYFALSTQDPTDSGTSLLEPGNGYARASAGTWVRNGDSVATADSVFFPVGSAQWTTTHLCIVDSATTGAGNVLAYVASSNTVPSGVVFTVPGGGFVVSFETATITITTVTGISSNAAMGSPTVRTLLPAGAPQILFTDVIAGPNSGGENNNGMYVRIFGVNFGSAGNLGTTTKVYINNVEVGAYHGLRNAKAQPFYMASVTLQEIAFQVGALTGCSAGVNYPIKVVVGGVSSNTDMTFMINPGNMIYVDPVTGSDTTGDGSIANPYRYVQNSTRTNPAWVAFTPGSVIIMRAGTWQDVGFDSHFCRWYSAQTGSAPTGTAGTGYYNIIGYPGDNVVINLTYAAGNYPGGFRAPPSSNYNYGHYVALSSIVIHDDDATKPDWTGDGPCNMATSGEYWRVVNMEITVTIGNVLQKSGAITGAARYAKIYGNYIHDVQGQTTYTGQTNYEPYTSHGMYYDNMSTGFEVAYNQIKNCTGGNGIQLNGNLGNICGYPFCEITNFSIHHNIVDTAAKHGINFNSCVQIGDFYNNIVMSSALAGFRLASDWAAGVNVYNNTFYNLCTTNNPNVGAIFWESYATNIATIQNNIIHAVGSAYYANYNGVGADAALVLNTNIYYGLGSSTPTKDTAPIYGDPLFVSTTPGSEDLRIQATSPAKDAGTAPPNVLLNDMFLNDRTNTIDIGAHEVG